ncbi:MAG: peptidoglycan-binding protein [Methylomonas sp.]|nr:peptidoglycan-binding protein [Methylomonas sp.]
MTMLFLFGLPLAASAQVGLTVDVESAVRAYFSETPVMVEIARCESKFRQFADSGNPLYGGYGGKMVGVFQVYSDIHASFARSLGMDIETLDGNLQYAKYLYEREGTKPWISSFPCWGSELNGDLSSAGSDSLSINLSLGMEHPQVLLLQKTLNAKGYVIATEGPGSLGSETSKFGSLTRAAVRKFQCAVMQICDGDEHSTGYGFVGSKTRAALLGTSVAATPPTPAPMEPTSNELSGYSESEQQQIKALQAQILELTKVLQALLGQR